MLKVTIGSVGKIKEKYLQQGIREYEKRLHSYVKLRYIEVRDEPAQEQLTEAQQNEIKYKEGERLLQQLPTDAYVIALDVQGKMKRSEELAADLDRLVTHGTSHIVFLIGGSLGWGDLVLQRAQERLSFSKMTFPHPMMKLILLEQIYRACRINAGHPYHK